MCQAKHVSVTSSAVHKHYLRLHITTVRAANRIAFHAVRGA